MTSPLIIYHAACRDGWCAAWVALRALPGAELFEGYYGQEPPYERARGRPVLIVDFSYKREQLEKLRSVALDLTVLDHHKTAQSNLEGLSYCFFDMNRSGAGMTWDFFHPGQQRPWPVNYVEDRDLWRFALPFSHEINAYLGVTPFDPEAWDNIADKSGIEFDACRRFGEFVIMKTNQYIAEVAKNAQWHRWLIADMSAPGTYYNAWKVNAPQVDISELGNHLVNKLGPDGQVPDMFMGWWQRADGLYQYSLRSKGDLDVSLIAKKFGGGGHKNAAGFQSKELL